MDSSYWVNLNHNIKLETTKKQYFNRYLWRLVYDIKKVNLATDKFCEDIVAYVIKHRLAANSGNAGMGYRGFYQSSNNYTYNPYINWDDVDEFLIDRVRTVIKTHKHIVKFRTEGNMLQVYAETEYDLKIISEAISSYDNLYSINIPKPGTEDALRNNVVFLNKTEYKYKIVLRDGNYPLETKRSILAQLTARDDVKIPGGVLTHLKKKYPALWGAYIYANDDSIATILSLISPGIVGKIHPIDHLQ